LRSPLSLFTKLSLYLINMSIKCTKGAELELNWS
jgi:hypothetical protein